MSAERALPIVPVALSAAVLSLVAGGIVAGITGALVSLGAFAAVALILLRGRIPFFDALPRMRGLSATDVRVGLILHDIFDDAGIGVLIADAGGRVLHANQSFGRFIRVPHERVQGSALAELFQRSDRVAVRHALELVSSGGAPMRELRLTPEAAPDVGLVLTIARFQQIGGVFISARDASFQMRMEAQVRQATKMQAVGQLAGGLAHDFNNILTAIIGVSDLMLMRHTPGSVDYQDIDQIRQNANRAANLVRQLLAFSRQQTLRPRVLRVSEIIGDLGHLLRRLLGETIRLKVLHGRDLAPVRVDPGQLEQVLVNLAVNARDAMPGGGELRIRTYPIGPAEVAALGHKMMPPADYVALEVEDTGSGIPPEILDNIFEPFFTTKETGKGTGLGLSMVYGIVKQTGGYIFASSPPGGGAVFNIYLPAAVGEMAEPLHPVKALQLEDWGKGRILLVEDEAMVRAVAERALKRSGYEVLAAASGDEALLVLEKTPDIDLLISDVVMPGMDGPALVAKVRAQRPALKVLYISGYAEEQIRDRVDGDTAALLRKPFSVSELSAAVRQRLAA